MKLLIVVLILFFIWLYVYDFNYKIVEGLNTFNGRMSVDDQYFYDKLFDDVIYYPNKYDKDYETGEEIGKLIQTGWQECREKCLGHCVEYGVHGASYCFNKPTGKEKYI